jgi:hypothetical protein
MGGNGCKDLQQENTCTECDLESAKVH